jgi:hypothetical protein
MWQSSTTGASVSSSYLLESGMQSTLHPQTRPALKSSCKPLIDCIRWRAIYAKFLASHSKGLTHMETEASLLRQLDNSNLTANQRAELRCQLAREYEDTGQPEAAREAMGELWQRVGQRPVIAELEQSAAAEVLLRVECSQAG